MKEETTRQQKVRKLLLREFSEIFNRMGHQIKHGVMFTVTTVRVTPDLCIAKVYLSIFPPADNETVLEKVRANTSKIRYELGLRVKNQLRIVPEPKFFIDDSLDYIEKIDSLLKK